MLNPPQTDKELINYILNLFFSENDYPYLNEEAIYLMLKEEKVEVNKLDINRLFIKLQKEEFIKKTQYADGAVWRLDHFGMEVMREYKSYSNYMFERDRKGREKEKIEKNERTLKNINSVITITSIFLASALTVFSLFDRQESKSKEQRIKELETQLDSLHKTEPSKK